MPVAATATRPVAEEVRRRVVNSRDRLWRADEFEGSPQAVNSELRRLVKAGELRRIRRGVYWRGRKTRFGMSHPRQGEALRSVLHGSEAVGATGWYATNLLGLSTQVSPVETLAVSRRPPTGFKQLRLVDRSSRTGRRDAKLNDLEVTLLEALEGWDQYVELSGRAATKRFAEVLGEEGIRVEKLVTASDTEPAAVRERLRYVLDAAGHNEAVHRVRPARSASARERALAVAT